MTKTSISQSLKHQLNSKIRSLAAHQKTTQTILKILQELENLLLKRRLNFSYQWRAKAFQMNY